jgi:3-hexulose-6-phosphate synthase
MPLLLQIALDKPEHLAWLPRLKPFADIIEIGTPLLKRFGIGAIATARELCPDVPVLADTKTVDGGQFEADMVFGAGAALMTVLSCASSATHEVVGRRAEHFGASVVVDTITQSGQAELLPAGASFHASFAYVAVHSPTDARLAGDASTAHIDAVRQMHQRGFRVSLAGGIGPATLDAVIAVAPEIVVVGSAITEADKPEEVAQWISSKLPDRGLGWPWDRK